MPLSTITQLQPFNINSAATFTFANTEVTANISAGNIKTDNLLYANGTAWAFGSYSNTNVASYLPTYSGLVSGTLSTHAQPNITSVGSLTSLTVTGLITSTAGGIKVGNLQDTSGTNTIQLTNSDIIVTGDITAGGGGAGNVTATYFIGNGSQLTGLPASYANANVAAYLPTYTGNFTAGNANVSGTLTVGTFATSGSSGNISGANYITANFFSGNGSLLTGLPAGYANSDVATYLPTYTGNLSPSNLTVSTSANLGAAGNVIITGGSSGQVLSTDGMGNLSWANTTSFIAKLDAFTGNGVQTAFTLSSTPTDANYIIVMAGGIVQPHSTYTLSGSTLTFSSAPPAIPIEVTTMGGTVGGGSGGASASTVYGLSIVFGNGF